jgi:CubicO group peptidase (beta-lactamase class C family)
MMLGILLPTPAFAAEPVPGADVTSELEAIRVQFGLPALAAAVMKDGNAVASGATGVRLLGTELKATINDRFHLGSDTKAMTATLAGMMVDAQKLDWTSKIGEVLGTKVPQMNADLAKLTLEQLLSHSSGLPTDNDKLMDVYFSSDALKYNIPEARIRALIKMKDQPPATPPGSAFHYSNFGYMIVGMMVETAAGIAWEQLITERIFAPLGLSTAGLGPQATTGKIDAPVGHDVEQDGKVTPMLWGPAADVPPLLGPAGSVHMSVLDFAKWASWNAGLGKRGPALVKPETLARIHQPMISTGKIPNPPPGTPSEGEYAMGWGVVKFDWTERPVLTHNGSNGFNLAKILVDANKDAAIVVTTNFPGEKAERAANLAVEKLYRRFAA